MSARNHSMHGAAAIDDYRPAPDERLLAEYAPLVKKIVLHLQARLPDSVQTDDLLQAGMIGLLDAAKSFDPTKGASFETYAGIRIRGAVLDEVRTSDWTPRSVSRNLREMAEAIHRAEARLGRPPTDREIAAEMGLALADYHRIAKDAAAARLMSTDEFVDEEGNNYLNLPSPDEQPDQALFQERFHEYLAQAIERLPERERLVMSLYYDEEMNLKEIGAVLGVSESRVSQIHGQALARLRAEIARWSDS